MGVVRGSFALLDFENFIKKRLFSLFREAKQQISSLLASIEKYWKNTLMAGKNPSDAHAPDIELQQPISVCSKSS